MKTFKEFCTQLDEAAWTKKAGQNKEGGLNEKGRKSYERENPGSDLKAPTKKKDSPRRKSFCARMRGMKKNLQVRKLQEIQIAGSTNHYESGIVNLC